MMSHDPQGGQATDFQAELAARLGAKRPALEQSMEVGGDDEWASDEAPPTLGVPGEGGEEGGKKKKKKRHKKKKDKKAKHSTSKESHPSTSSKRSTEEDEVSQSYRANEDTPMAAPGGLFSGSGALFDDEEGEGGAPGEGGEGVEASGTQHSSEFDVSIRPRSGTLDTYMYVSLVHLRTIC